MRGIVKMKTNRLLNCLVLIICAAMIITLGYEIDNDSMVFVMCVGLALIAGKSMMDIILERKE